MNQRVGVVLGEDDRVAMLQLGKPVVEHAHPHAQLLFKISGPDCQFTVDGIDCPLTDETVVLVNPWSPHASRAISHAGETYLLAVNCYAKTYAGRLLRFSRPCLPLPRSIRRQVDLIAGRLAAGTLDQADIQGLIHAVARAFSARDADRRHAPHVDYRIRRVLKATQRAGSGEPLVEDLPASAGLSRSRFFELFRQGFGVSPRAYFNALRLEEAIGRLADKNSPIGDIARELGFRSSAHFTRFVRHHLGSPPSELRRGARKLAERSAGPVPRAQ